MVRVEAQIEAVEKYLLERGVSFQTPIMDPEFSLYSCYWNGEPRGKRYYGADEVLRRMGPVPGPARELTLVSRREFLELRKPEGKGRATRYLLPQGLRCAKLTDLVEGVSKLDPTKSYVALGTRFQEVEPIHIGFYGSVFYFACLVPAESGLQFKWVESAKALQMTNVLVVKN